MNYLLAKVALNTYIGLWIIIIIIIYFFDKTITTIGLQEFLINVSIYIYLFLYD